MEEGGRHCVDVVRGRRGSERQVGRGGGEGEVVVAGRSDESRWERFSLSTISSVVYIGCRNVRTVSRHSRITFLLSSPPSTSNKSSRSPPCSLRKSTILLTSPLTSFPSSIVTRASIVSIVAVRIDFPTLASLDSVSMSHPNTVGRYSLAETERKISLCLMLSMRSSEIESGGAKLRAGEVRDVMRIVNDIVVDSPGNSIPIPTRQDAIR